MIAMEYGIDPNRMMLEALMQQSTPGGEVPVMGMPTPPANRPGGSRSEVLAQAMLAMMGNNKAEAAMYRPNATGRGAGAASER